MRQVKKLGRLCTVTGYEPLPSLNRLYLLEITLHKGSQSCSQIVSFYLMILFWCENLITKHYRGAVAHGLDVISGYFGDVGFVFGWVGRASSGRYMR